MADQLALLLDAFRRGRRVRSKATGREGTISGTAMRRESRRGKPRTVLAVSIRRDDGTDHEAAHYMLDVLDENGKEITTWLE